MTHAPNALLPVPPPWQMVLVFAFLPIVFMSACGGGDEDGVDATTPAVEVGAAPAAAPSETASAAPSGSGSAPAPVPAAATSSDGFCGISGFETALLNGINAARGTAQSCGGTAYSPVAPLNWSAPLFLAAEMHSQDMAANNFFSHTGSNGTSVAQRVNAAGYGWRSVAENIAAGQSSPQAVMAGWMASPGHCANIMNPTYQDVAVACAHRAGSSFGRYWTMVAAKPK